jgi:hypothetical protein
MDGSHGRRAREALFTAAVMVNAMLVLWNQLPPSTYWFLPAAVGLPVLLRALHRHSVRAPRRPGRPEPA